MPSEPNEDSSKPKPQGKLSAEDRQAIIDRVGAGEMQVVLAQEFGVTRQYVSLLMQKFRNEGKVAIEGGKRGRKPSRPLTPDEEEAIHHLVKKHKTPRSAGLDVGKKRASNVWNLDSVKKLVVRECSFTPRRSTVIDLLEKWGMAPAKPSLEDGMEFSKDYYDYINSPIGREVSRKTQEMRERQLAERAAEATAEGAEGEVDYSEEDLAKIRRKMLAGKPMGGGGGAGQRVGKHRNAKTAPKKKRKKKSKRRKK